MGLLDLRRIPFFGSVALIGGRGKWPIWDLADALTSHGNCVLVSVIRWHIMYKKVWFCRVKFRCKPREVSWIRVAAQ